MNPKFSYLSAIENRLSDDQKDILKKIYEPQVVGVPLDDARRSLCVMPDGELRCYGILYIKERCHKPELYEGEQPAYIYSTDGGLSWSTKYAYGAMAECLYIPEKEIYISSSYFNNKQRKGLYALISKIGPGDENPEYIKIADDEIYFDTFLPQKSEYSDRIWFTSQSRSNICYGTPIYVYSDNFGKSWNIVRLPIPKMQEVIYPHKGMRWCHCCGSEPHAVEISRDKMMMIIRNSTDFFYCSYSYDGGETWTNPEPSVFHGTDTTAYLLKLSNGKTVAFWNNTQPLSELRHEKQLLPPPGSDGVFSGMWEDVFTNRDVNHAAITDDAENWTGFRELHLNTIRNNSDFRYIGRKETSADKSVHQFQALELPFGKILVAMGQNEASRKLVIFDINWLYETSNSENFLVNGLSKISTHVYLKSLSGCTVNYGGGHCAWNRTNGAVMMPDPDGTMLDCVLISKHHDSRLFNDIQGVVWNFPASKQGCVKTEIKLLEKRVRISLADHWFNPCDEYCGALSQFTFELDTDDISSVFTKIAVKYDTEKGFAQVFDETAGRLIFGVKMSGEAKCGLSYIIVQCATDGDSEGVYLRMLEKSNI